MQLDFSEEAVGGYVEQQPCPVKFGRWDPGNMLHYKRKVHIVIGYVDIKKL
jgi:hypothetical protein